jgi:hypothetical protein
MLLLVAALMAAPTPAVAVTDAPAPDAPRTCRHTTSYRAWMNGKPPPAHKLTELPPANAYYTVYRRIAGCEVPIIVKYGVGSR